ncbi:E3 ubiquitin-protein ligase RAD18 isoform 2-T2 [Clarias gariepinus]
MKKRRENTFPASVDTQYFRLKHDCPIQNIDTLLRCPICFDFLNISMMTQCSHNFCSLCIRKFLCYKLQCPLCNTPLTEQELRNNRLLDDVVQSFQAVRQQLSQTNFESPPISPKTPTMPVGGKAARQKGLRKEGTTLTQFFQKRAPINSQSGLKGLHCVKQEPMEVCVQGVILPESAVTVSTALKEEKRDVPMFPSTSQDIKPVVKVECPVCGVEVSQQNINKHLDTCLTRDEKKDSLRRSDHLVFPCSACIEPKSQKRRPMPKLVYTLLTTVELKRRLKDCHLSTQGPREQLIRRHQEFTQIYNAQCDALNPRSSEDIAREVDNNEKMRSQLEKQIKPAIVITKNHTVDEIERLHSDYRKQHSGEFSRLIAQVRGRLENSRKTQKKQEGGESAETFSANDTVLQDTVQPPVSLPLEIANNERTCVIDLGSRSQSPTLSDVSVSRLFVQQTMI